MLFLELFKLEKDKTATVLVFFKLNQREKREGRRYRGVVDWFLEREHLTSL